MSILSNAIDSIQVGVEDYLMRDSKRYLSAVRNICAGILLLYKEKLCQLSPSHDKEVLIKKDIRPSDDGKGNVTFIVLVKRQWMFKKSRKDLAASKSLLIGRSLMS